MKRIGLYLSRLPGWDKRGFDRRELIECVRAADACGYDSFWMSEAWERDAFTILTDLAGKTERIGLGTGIVNVYSRSPAVLAMSAATLDEISGGRFRLGLGTSGERVVEDFHGIKFDRPVVRLKETVQIVRMLLAGDRIDLEGECFKVARFKLGFKPLRSQIPIYIAALARRSLHQLGEIGDGWLPVHWPPAELHQGIDEIKKAATSSGRDSSSIEIAPFVNLVVSNDVDHARDRARLPLAYYIGGMGKYYFEAVSRLGFGEEAGLVQRLWQAGKPREALRAISDHMIDQLAICGSLEHCRSRLIEIYEVGATIPIVPIPSEGTLSEKCQLIESLVSDLNMR